MSKLGCSRQTEHKHVQYEVVPDRVVFIPGCLALWARGRGSVGASEGRQVPGFRKYQVFGTKVLGSMQNICDAQILHFIRPVYVMLPLVHVISVFNHALYFENCHPFHFFPIERTWNNRFHSVRHLTVSFF